MGSRFKHYPVRPKRLTAGFAKVEYARLLKRLPAAEAAKSPEAWLKLFADWNALKSYVGSEGGRIYHRFSKNMENKTAAAAEKYFREEIVPEVDKPEHQLMVAFLDSRHRSAMAKKYGEHLVEVYQTALKPFEPINSRLRIKNSRLVEKYEKLLAQGTVKIGKQKMTLNRAGSLLSSEDRTVRKEAYFAIADWFLKQHRPMSQIYQKLLAIRNQMGVNVGYKSFTPLAYEAMGRADYDESEVKQFRANVRKYVVPLRRKLMAKHAASLGTKQVAPWDASFNPDLTLALGIVPVDSQLDKAQRLFNKLSPWLAKHFKTMRAKNLIDLEDRPGKRSGAYCTAFSDEGVAAIFCNSTGDAPDVRTLTHEMGHAFQYWESQAIEAVDLQGGTADLAEVESTGMEFMSLRHIDEFFKPEDSKKFVENCWLRTINLLGYVCVVDEFQHWAYANPEASFAKFDAKWIELSDKYTPGISYKGAQKYRKIGRVNKHHIFTVPFYYIDYGLAATAAMQLALIDAKDHKKAMTLYRKLCQRGGTQGFLTALKSSGLRSPFDEKLMADLVAHASKILL